MSRKLQSLLSDPSRPWVQKLLGAGFNPDKSIGDLVTQGVGWLTTFLHSLWSGGRALVSLFSLVVVTPVVAFYLLYDWHRMIAHRRRAGSRATSATPCASSRARSTRPSPASCAGRPRSA